MKHLLLTLGLVVTLAGQPAAAQTESSDAIRGTIQSQIDAFLADDFATAFTFASPAIKGMFGNPDNFGMMVRQGYPMVWRPSDLRFLDLREMAGRHYQRVQIVDREGVPYIAEYEMIETAEGWQINGVRIERAPEVGA